MFAFVPYVKVMHLPAYLILSTAILCYILLTRVSVKWLRVSFDILIFVWLLIASFLWISLGILMNGIGLVEIRTDDPYGLVYRSLAFAVLASALYLGLNSRKDLYFVLSVLVLLQVISCLLIIVEFVNPTFQETIQSVQLSVSGLSDIQDLNKGYDLLNRPSGLALTPVSFSYQSAITFPLLYALRSHKTGIAKILSNFMLSIAVAGPFLALSKSGVFGIVIALCSFTNPRRSKLLLKATYFSMLAFLVISIFLVFGSSHLGIEVSHLVNIIYTDDRPMIALRYLIMAFTYPLGLFSSGIGHINEYLPFLGAPLHRISVSSHNYFINVLLYFGLVLGAIQIAFGYSVARKCFRIASALPQSEPARVLIQGLSISWISVVPVMMTHNGGPFVGEGTSVLLTILSIWAVSHCQKSDISIPVHL